MGFYPAFLFGKHNKEVLLHLLGMEEDEEE